LIVLSGVEISTISAGTFPFRTSVCRAVTENSVQVQENDHRTKVITLAKDVRITGGGSKALLSPGLRGTFGVRFSYNVYGDLYG